MPFERLMTDDALLQELGRRIAQQRLDRNLSQAQLAEQAGISKRTLERLEAGASATQLSLFLRVLRQLDLLERLDLLILDELGYVPFSKTGAELLFDVVSRAYERTSVVITTNLPFENWTEVLGSERLTGAMLDRLTHRVHILEANGESYRLLNAKKRAWLKEQPLLYGGPFGKASATLGLS